MKKLLSLFLLCLFVLLPAHAGGVQFITMTGTGSLADTALRQVAPAIERELGAAVVIQNQPGAGGVLAARQVLDAPADGATILVGNPSLGHMRLTGAAKGFDPIEDFVPLQGLATSEFGVFVPSESPVRSAQDLAQLRDPMVGSASPMSTMSAALMDQRLGMKSTVVGYKQFAQAVADLAGGRLDYMTGPSSASAVQGMLQSGKIRQIDTLRSLGVPDFGWTGFFVHRNTPLSVQRRLSHALQRAVLASSLPGKLTADGMILRRIQRSEVPQMEKALAPR